MDGGRGGEGEGRRERDGRAGWERWGGGGMRMIGEVHVTEVLSCADAARPLASPTLSLVLYNPLLYTHAVWPLPHQIASIIARRLGFMHLELTLRRLPLTKGHCLSSPRTRAKGCVMSSAVARPPSALFLFQTTMWLCRIKNQGPCHTVSRVMLEHCCGATTGF